MNDDLKWDLFLTQSAQAMFLIVLQCVYDVFALISCIELSLFGKQQREGSLMFNSEFHRKSYGYQTTKRLCF